jgi:hypothetical protein
MGQMGPRGQEAARALLSERDAEGRIAGHPYDKWRGAHWVLSMLADIGYPAGDEGLIPLRDQVLEWLLRRQPRTVDGRVRVCCSIEGNAVWYLLKLGLADERVDRLVERMLEWQWPDGGWNCDLKADGKTSSFMETLIPLRALALYAERRGASTAREAARGAAEVFLSRRLFRRRTDGSVIHPTFLRLHYPCYWHYDILFGLRVMAEAGFIGDERCAEALDLLESKRLPEGGWPAEEQYYQVGPQAESRQSLVDWGGASKRVMNEWVTAQALAALEAAKRIQTESP